MSRFADRGFVCSFAVALAAAFVLLLSPAISRAATTVNGDFETGTFAGWTVYNQELAPGTGNWFVYSGTTSALSGFTIAAPPQGTFAATTDQSAPGSHILYQDVALEPGFNHTLSFVLYYANRAGAFATPESLHFLTIPNQQYRVDIMKPTAHPISVVASDVLATVFRTNVGDPLTKAPTSMSFNLSAFAGTTVRLRFSEVETSGFFQASVDNVAVSSTTPCTIKITNRGWIVTDDGARGSFDGFARETSSGADSGREEYQDHGPAEPMNVHSLDVQAVTCNTTLTQASIFGQAQINGTGTHNYRIDVQDNGEPGKLIDHYRIRLDTGYDSGDQVLRGGNVQIH